MRFPLAYSDDPPILQGEAMTRLSEAEFYQFCQDNPHFDFERTAAHEIIVMPPAHPDASEAGSEVSGQLWLWNRQAQQPGHVYESSAGFRLPDGSVRAPDVAWLSRAARQAAGEAAPGFLPACPEFVVEIRSPTDRLPALQAKLEMYLANGVQLGLLLDPEHETAHVYRPDQDVETLASFDTEVQADPVLPGFRLDLRPLRRLGV